jgi:hypothetical protein
VTVHRQIARDSSLPSELALRVAQHIAFGCAPPEAGPLEAVID